MTLDRELWGPPPTDSEIGAAAIVARQAEAEARAALPVDWDRGPDGERLPYLDDARRAYPGSELSFAVWMTTPNPDLDAITPAQALVAGRRDEVVHAAAVLQLGFN